jgi:hypothetical protein
MMSDHYQTKQEIEAVVTGFENCTTGKADFTHLSHLTVAVCYLRDLTPEQAFQKMSAGLFRFLDHHSVGRAKYSEQITRAWLTLVHEVMKGLDSQLSTVAIANVVLDRLGSSRIEIEREK